jgi:hypothetical protein
LIGMVAMAAALVPVGAGAAGPSFSRPAGLPAQPQLYGAACPTATTCVVVGGADVATVLTSTDAGRTWASTTVAGIGALYGVACFDAHNCVAVGTAGGVGSDAIAVTHDGQTWTAVASLPAAPALSSVSCVAPSRCMAVGAVSGGTSGWTAAALFSADGGATWATAATPTHQGTPTALNAVRCPATQRCFVVGGGAWVTDNFGGSWRDISPPDGCTATAALCLPTYSDLTGLDFTDAAHGAVVGGEQCGGQVPTKCPSVFFSTSDGGGSWKMWPASNNSLAFLEAVRCSGLHCFALSNGPDGGTVLGTSDGATWAPVGSFNGVQLNGIACAPGGPCVVAGQVRSAGILLVAASGLAAIGGGGSTTVSPGPGGGGGGGSGTANSVVSSFSTSIPTPAAVGSSVPALLLSALLVLGLVLLVVFPSQLFNRTYEANHDRIRTWWERRLPWARAGRERAQTRALHGAAALAVAVLAGAMLGTLLDPKAGWNERSAALFAGIVLSLVFSIALGAVVTAAYRRVRKRGTRWELRALPSGLVVAALCVLVSRVVNFQPGYLYGIIGGIAFAGALPRNEEGHLVALSSGVTLAVAVIAWLLWVPAVTAAGRAGAGFGTALWANVLSALFVGGLAGVVIGLVPLRFLPGEKLAAWHWGAWATVFALAMFGLVQIMLRPQSASAHVASVPLWTTVGLFLAFGTASVAFWAYFREKSPRENAAVVGETTPRD